MSTIKYNDINTQNIQALNNQLNELLEKAKKINQEIDETNKKAKEDIDAINAKVDDSIMKIEQMCSNLDQIEKEAEDELDALILQQANELKE